MPHGGASTFIQIPTVGPREEGKYIVPDPMGQDQKFFND